ncbi:MAG: hypothetical protein V3W34_11250, partial [Phycisphaerae bacterium]
LLAVLDAGIDQLPAEVAAGHRTGDEIGEVHRAVVARSDSAGCSVGFVDGCRDRNIGFQVVARRKTAVSAGSPGFVGDSFYWFPTGCLALLSAW